MSYRIKEVTIRTNNSEQGLKQIEELWKDLSTGKIPVLFDNEGKFQKEVLLVSRYNNYESNEIGDYDLTVLALTKSFFEDMEIKVSKGEYKKYDFSFKNNDLGECCIISWGKVCEDQKNGVIKRSFTNDYDCSIPAEYSEDGYCRCIIYIALKK